MNPIIAPIDKQLLQMELKKAVFMKPTNKGDNELYIVSEQTTPNIMQEIGRLREISFRLAGGGTGEAVDIDNFDICETPYQQLIVWNPKDSEILGGYRYIVSPPSIQDLATSELFNFSPKFVTDYLPHTIELGRSFVQPNYQNSRNNTKSLFALDNLWDGLGGLMYAYPEIKYFLGKVTMYTSYNKDARNMLHYFLQKYFPDKEQLITPIHSLELNIDVQKMQLLFTGNSYKEDYKILSREVRALGENIPPLINSYMNLSPSMKTFGCAINHEFGGVEETGILITINEVYPAKKERHIYGHIPNKLNIRNLFRKPQRKELHNNVTITT
ncbi:hemolysin A [Bacteroidia bacterium]|nr:hemolysin A [Bacteroidia bacterium]